MFRILDPFGRTSDLKVRGSLSLITIKSSFSKIFSLISAIKTHKILLEFHSTRKKSNIVPFSMFRVGARTISVIFRILDTGHFIQGSTDRPLEIRPKGSKISLASSRFQDFSIPGAVRGSLTLSFASMRDHKMFLIIANFPFASDQSPFQ